MTDAPEQERTRRFPALDPEPPAPPWWRRLLPLVAALVVGGGVAAAVVLPGGAPKSRVGGPAGNAIVAVPGRLLVVLPGGGLATTNAQGGQLHKLPGPRPGSGYAVASADGRYAVSLRGQVLQASGSTVRVVPGTSWPAALVAEPLPPFADHDRYVVAYPGRAGQPVYLVPVGGGDSVTLGLGDLAAGDPAAPGAFVTVPAPPQPAAQALQMQPDDRLELRDLGKPPVLLGSAAKLMDAVGGDPKAPIALLPYPSPTGDLVAVVIAMATGSRSGPAQGLVVLDRTGHVTAEFSWPEAPLAGAGVSWSPSGGSFAYTTRGGQGLELVVKSTAGGSINQQFPTNGQGSGHCVWSADGADVVCPTGQLPHLTWVIIPATGGMPALVGDAPGWPIAWLPGGHG